jgi:hypothetical protein
LFAEFLEFLFQTGLIPGSAFPGILAFCFGYLGIQFLELVIQRAFAFQCRRGLKKLTNFCHMDFSSAEVVAAVAKTINGMDMARNLFMGEMIEKSLYNTICFYYI